MFYDYFFTKYVDLLVEENERCFYTARAFHIFSTKISAYFSYMYITYDVVSFEQLGPDLQILRLIGVTLSLFFSVRTKCILNFREQIRPLMHSNVAPVL